MFLGGVVKVAYFLSRFVSSTRQAQSDEDNKHVETLDYMFFEGFVQDSRQMSADYRYGDTQARSHLHDGSWLAMLPTNTFYALHVCGALMTARVEE